MLIVGDDISNNVVTLNWLVFFNESLFTFALISASRWLVEISQLSQWGATGDLGVEFKLQALLPFSALLSVHLESLLSDYCYSIKGDYKQIWR